MAKSKLKIGIVGCGAIGSFIAKTCRKDLSDKIEIAGICDIDESKATSLAKELKKKVEVLKLDELIRRSDLIVEAASKEVAASIARKAISRGRSVMVMSVGGLLDSKDIFELAEAKKVHVFIPSGAVCGLDGLKGALVAGIKSVLLTTIKSKKGLEGAPYLLKNRIDLAKIDKETVLFEGSAAEAIEGFPKNINVAAVLSLAGIGPKKTRVRVVLSPSAGRNIHELRVSGDFGVFSARTENVPFPENPKTSMLAAFSAVAMLSGIVATIKIGT